MTRFEKREVLGFLLPLVGFSVLVALHERVPFVGADSTIRSAIVGMRSALFTPLMQYASASAGTIPIIVVTALLTVELLRARRVTAAGRTVAIVAGGTLLSAVFKILIGRVRPPLEEMITLPSRTMSMPSGHTMASLCVGSALIWALVEATPSTGTRTVTVAAVVAWMALVGSSRVYLGVHWPSDVAAAWLLGIAWLAAVGTLTRSSRTGSPSTSGQL